MKVGVNVSDRLSYLQSNEERDQLHEYSTVFNPCKSLTEVFNSICEEEVESENLKVYLRIRPTLFEESINSHDGNIEILNPRSIQLTAPNNSHIFRNKPHGTKKVSHKFTFTHVYNQAASQKILFDETTQSLVKDLVNGQNCLLFTYGATNSGKTYTIQGTPVNPGLLPRTLDILFKTIGHQNYNGNDLRPQHFCGVVRMNEKEVKKEEEIKEEILKYGLDVAASSSRSSISFESHLSQDSNVLSPCSSMNDSVGTCTSENITKEDSHFDDSPVDGAADSIYYAIFVSFAEIYNEYIYDLLDQSSFCKKNKKNPLAFGEDRNGAIYIKGLKEVRVRSTEEAIQVLDVGKHCLHFAATKLNHHSSRSHCIFTIKLVRLADPLFPHVARVSMLSLCDLAGAERAGKTLNSIDRLKEANNINTSLLVLGRCMVALRQNQIISKQAVGPRKQIPVPYRDSKVTRLFQSFFMGKGKVAMIVNISTSSLLYDETLKVLKFSALANKVTITQEKQPNEQPVQEKKLSNQFSRLMRHSLNISSSSGSGMLSAPWNNKSFADVTFGGNEDVEHSRMGVLPEELEDEDEDERYTALLILIEKLKEKLLKESKDKTQLETKLRKEICDAFSQRIVQIESTWKNRLEEERAISDEYNEWRINHVLNSVKKPDGGRKRLRTENDSFNEDEEVVPSILLAREEIKVQNLEEENTQLNEELRTLKLSLKLSGQATKCAKEENSKLIFQLADLSRHLTEVQKEKESLEVSVKQYQAISSENKESDLKVIVKDLQNQVLLLQKSEALKELELKNVKDLLMEAAEEFREKEIVIQNLQIQSESTKSEYNNQSVLICDLENQLSETKEMCSRQRNYFEEREQVIQELQAELEILKDKESLSTSSMMEEMRRNYEEALEEKRTRISKLMEEKDLLIFQMSDLKNKKLDKSELKSATQCLKDEMDELVLESNSNSGVLTLMKKDDLEHQVQLKQLENEKFNLQQIIEKLVTELEDLKCSTLKNSELEVDSEENKQLIQKVAEWEKCCSDLTMQIESFKQTNKVNIEAETDKFIEKLDLAELKITELYKEKEITNANLRTLVESNGKLDIRLKAALNEKELLANEVSHLKLHIEETLDKNDKLLTNLTELECKMNEATKEKEILETLIAEFEEKMIKNINEKDILSSTITELQSQIKNVIEGKEMLTANFTILEKKIQEVLEEKELLASKVIDLEKHLKAFEEGDVSESRESLLEEVMRLISVIDAKEEEICHLSKNLENIFDEHKKFKQKSEDNEEIIALKEMTIKELWRDLESLRDVNDKQSQNIFDCQNKLESCIVNEKRLEEEKFCIEEKYKEATCTIEKYKVEIKEINSNVIEVNNKTELITSELKNKILQLQDENKNLEKDVEELHSKVSLALEQKFNLQLKETENEILTLKNEKESLFNKYEVISRSLEKYSQNDEVIKKLSFSLQDLEGMNIKLVQELHEADEERLKLQNELEVVQNFKDQNLKLKEMLAICSKKEKDLEELHFKSQTEIHSMSFILEEKGETVGKMAAKIESLDKKINLTEEELKTYQIKCEIHEKEVAALREARNEDSKQLRTVSEEKDACIACKEEEIVSLQQEIKKLLQSSISVSSITTEDEQKVKEEVGGISSLQGQLGASAEENMLLKLQLSSLQEELQVSKGTIQMLHDSNISGSAVELSSSLRKKSPAGPKDTPSKSSRSTRTRKAERMIPLISIENSIPESLHLNLEASDCDEVNSAVKTQSTRKRRGRNVKSKYNLNESLDDVEFKVPSSHAKTGTSKMFTSIKCSASEEEDIWQPEVSGKVRVARTSKCTKAKSKISNVKVYNPHLDKENKSRERSSSVDQENEVEKSASPTLKPARSRSRRQRPLYNIHAIDEPFECAPNMIQLHDDEDSPHTAVRRMLRSKSKPK